MKRKTRAETSATPRKQPRQDPVSCESCRRKKLKCDRCLPCSNCASRRTDCSYGGYGPGTASLAKKAGIQTAERPSLDNTVTPPRVTQSTKTPHDRTQSRSAEDPLMTADRLENILMGHRVPSAVPAPLRKELSRHGRMHASRPHRNTASGTILGVVRGGRVASHENPATVHLPSFLPSEAEAMRLFDYYHNHLDYQYHLIIPTRTKCDIYALYESIARDKPGNLNHIALLFSILATSLFFQLLSTEPAEVAEMCSREAAFLTGAALIQSNYLAYPNTEGLQAAMIIAHHLSTLTLNPSVSSLFLHGGLVSQAKSLGLHLLDSPRTVDERRQDEHDKAETELKRRLWWDLASYDWLIGFLSGPQEWTYTIQPQHMNVHRPLNIEDDHMEYETNLPLSTPTCMSYTLCRLRLAEVCREIVDAAAPEYLQGQGIGYETVLDLDRKLQQAYSEIPAFFRFDQSSRREFACLYRERPEIAWQRAFIQQGYHSRFCRLHRQYFVRGAKDPRYSYSHVVSLQSARRVLEVKRIMDEEEPLFTPNSSCFWAVMHHVFMAAVTLLIDVCFNWDDILADRRKEEVLNACRLLSRAQQSSSVAREGINAMMGILRKHWKQEKRPDSRGQQAQVPSSPLLDASALHYQEPILPVNAIQEPKDVYFTHSAPTRDSLAQVQSTDSASAELGAASLEDLWNEMLDKSAHVGLGTPDWMDLLTELTNTTVPCE
ncbi:uncharacterized protein N7482_009238 [Penicillium canariense]|uniref:Zn(2)-C6 fungal-type domain-containing protein n=1 Tax=Penicillium canariense TaxID=189055 RepID=A0A9W9HQ08_9EURO|nr:uncharacterized protein N7482_009238 [Penicillium canariense]KAJ5152760.1 hypothetical protein N7482_009238 [Penicillium canariense]